MSDADDEARRRRRRARALEALGEALPDTTGDERDRGWGERPDRDREPPDDDWLRDQVPPHHG